MVYLIQKMAARLLMLRLSSLATATWAIETPLMVACSA